MRLYMFEHCSLCFRVRMTAALKRVHLQETVLLDDDTDTMVGLVGKRQIPILVRDDGRPMLESMAMVEHIESRGAPIFVGHERAEISEWAEAFTPKIARLTQPRYSLLGLPEFATAAAHDNYVLRKRQALGDLVELRAKTRNFLRELAPQLDALDRLIESPHAINGLLSLDDVRVLPLLRSAATVKGLRLPDKVCGYFETAMAMIGHQPLPAI